MSALDPEQTLAILTPLVRLNGYSGPLAGDVTELLGQSQIQINIQILVDMRQLLAVQPLSNDSAKRI